MTTCSAVGSRQLKLSSEQSSSLSSPVYVTLPLDDLGGEADPVGTVGRREFTAESIGVLAEAGVEGVVMDVWWALVEREPRVYHWEAFLEMAEMVQRSGLKIRVVLAFHSERDWPTWPKTVDLPLWILEEFQKNRGLGYKNRYGCSGEEYISLGCDTLPVLRGRSPLETYADFMRSFRDNFRPFLGHVITGIQVGMGSDGELKYPSANIHELVIGRTGEFNCYDKYMVASLQEYARELGMPEWGDVCRLSEPLQFAGIKGNGNDDSWNTPYGAFLLEWYSGMLLMHGERICEQAEAIFSGTNVTMSGKLGGYYYHYLHPSHISELTAGYYNTSTRDGYLPFARMFARHGFTLCCSSFDLKDETERYCTSSPEGLLKQILSAARLCGIPVEGESSDPCYNGRLTSLKQVVKMSKNYLSGLENPSFSFKLRADKFKSFKSPKYLLEKHSRATFTDFVRRMSNLND
ncbi:PREDICTED: beta-amylase 3, chloroplastic-like [Fragaria vesca subsp. vesca]|uniref:beta-amylase 3, chloroplastic-like n=1 Tax=Fragaria vesca subsp. vesca TaxID=101020 RepID=UPI0002C2ED54|nr:PREDICTED: beta-amylase 3, chloroplastic-like [Fragaria vesca subsp. vesca]